MVASGYRANRGARAPDPRQPRHGPGWAASAPQDPFDRILVAQAKGRGLGLVTSDGPLSSLSRSDDLVVASCSLRPLRAHTGLRLASIRRLRR